MPWYEPDTNCTLPACCSYCSLLQKRLLLKDCEADPGYLVLKATCYITWQHAAIIRLCCRRYSTTAMRLPANAKLEVFLTATVVCACHAGCFDIDLLSTTSTALIIDM